MIEKENKINIIVIKVSFLNENLKLISLMLMYIITLGYLLSSEVNYANITQDE